MIEVRVILPDGRATKGRLDPTVSIDDALADIVDAYSLGDPDKYEIAVVPKSRNQSLSGYRLMPGDTIWVQPRGKIRGKSFIPGE